METQVTPLAVGTPALDFTLRHTPTLSLSLHRFTGRPTVLVFYPMAFEPVSAEQVCLFQAYLPDFGRLDTQLLGISAEHVWCNQAFAQQAGVEFPLLSDTPPSGRISRLYGVYREQVETSARALFVIDRGGIVRFGKAYPDLINPGVDEVLTVLEHMRGKAE